MSDLRHRNFERPGSPFWGIALVLVAVITGLVAYAYRDAHTIPGSATGTTEGRTADQLSKPGSQPGGETN